ADRRALPGSVAGRELATLKRRLGDATAARAEQRNEEVLLKRRLADLDTAVMGAEAELGTLGGSEVGDALARAQALREKARGQLALLAKRRRGVDRERAAAVDQGVIASLEADSARLRADLAAAAAGDGGVGPRRPGRAPPSPPGPPRTRAWPPRPRPWPPTRTAWPRRSPHSSTSGA